MRLTFIYILTPIIFLGCEFNDKPVKRLESMAAHNKSEKQSDNPIISVEPSEQVNLEDYWEEASSIKSEAEQILNLAKSIHCKEATGYAQDAILIARKTAETKNFSEAEQLLGEAGEIVQNAESALLLCQDKPE